MKPLRVLSIASSVASAITKEDIIFIISVLIVILQLLSGYLERKKGEVEQDS